MASRRELLEQLRAAQKEMFPIAPGKLKKHEIALALESIKSGIQTAKSAPPKVPEKPGRAPREVKIADVLAGDSVIHMPEPPAKRLVKTSTKAEVAAYRESLGPAPERVPKPPPKRVNNPGGPRGRPKKVAIADPATDNPFPAVASHAAASPGAVVDEDDPRAAKIVRKGPFGRPALAVPLAPTKTEAPKAVPPEMMAAFSAWYASQKS